MYNILIRPFVRRMNPDKASKIALGYFKAIGRIPLERQISRIVHKNRPAGLEREVFGLDFYNPVGLGAGLDIRGELYNDLADLGVSFVEIGPLNASTVRGAVRNLQADPSDDILAVCIGGDHLTTLSLAYDFADFFVIDIPDAAQLETILTPLLDLRLSYDDYKPVVAKIPESLSPEKMAPVMHFLQMSGVDGIETRSLAQPRQAANLCKGRLPIIANTHVKGPEEALELLDAGASLVEIRSGLVKEGPRFVGKVLNYLENNAKKSGQSDR